MNVVLRGVFEKLETEREQILQTIESLTEEHYGTSLNSRWSISQILTHLITSERLALRYMKKKSLGIAQLPNSGWIEPMKLVLLRASQRLPLRYKAPQTIIDHTPAALTLAETKQQWPTSRLELQQFLESIDEKNVHKLIFKHPIAGKLNVIQGVAFLREHQLHHLPQIKRLLK
jgi:uncharacterized damage-inducible protein DinB